MFVHFPTDHCTHFQFFQQSFNKMRGDSRFLHNTTEKVEEGIKLSY